MDDIGSGFRTDQSRVDSSVHQGVANVGEGNVHVGQIHYNSECRSSTEWTVADKNMTDYGHLAKRPSLPEALWFEGMEFRQASVKSADASTCQWLLETPEYRGWRSGSHVNKDHRRLFWIKGPAGAGKSTLMKYTVNQSPTSDEQLVISHFFDAQGVSELEKSAEGMYRTLLYRILDNVPALEVMELTPKHIPVRNGHWPLEALVRLLNSAIPKMKVQLLTIFIDALDECEERQVRDMVRVFEALIIANASLRVCFASRPYPHVSSASASVFDISFQSQHSKSITQYIKSHINIGNSPVAKAVERELVRKAGSVFMWAYLVVDILNREYDKGRLDTLRDILDRVPDDLQQLYRQILQRDTENQRERRTCFQALVSARRALLVQDVWWIVQLSSHGDFSHTLSRSRALSVNDMERYIIDISRGLVQGLEFGNLGTARVNLAPDERDAARYARFAHESIVEFGLKHGGFSEEGTTIPSTDFLVQSHAFMREFCSRLLSPDVIQALVCDLPERGRMIPRGYLSLIKQRRSARIWTPMMPSDIWCHAEAAHVGGFDQADFLRTFDLKAYVLFCGIYEVCSLSVSLVQTRYRSTTNLLYLLMSNECQALIRSCLVQMAIQSPRFGLEEGNGFHQSPINNALATYKWGNIRAVMDLYQQHKVRDPRICSILESVADTVAVILPMLLPRPSRGRCYKQGLLDTADMLQPLATFLLIALISTQLLHQHQLDGLREASSQGFAQTVNFMLREGIQSAALELAPPKAETLLWALSQPFQPLADIVARRFELLPTSKLSFSPDHFATTGTSDLFMALRTGTLNAESADHLSPYWSSREEHVKSAEEESFQDLSDLISAYQDHLKDSRHIQAHVDNAKRSHW